MQVKHDLNRGAQLIMSNSPQPSSETTQNKARLQNGDESKRADQAALSDKPKGNNYSETHQIKPPSLSIYWDPRIVTIALLGVVSGLPWSLTHTTLGYWLSTEGISMKTVGLFALTSLPYAFKFLWAPLFDVYHAPIISKGRSGWMIISQIGLLGSLIAMSMLQPKLDVEFIALLALLTSLFSASQDIAVDGWRVDALSDDEQGVGSSIATLGYRIGMYVSSAGALFMSAFLPWRWVYISLASLVALGMLASWYTASQRLQARLTPAERQAPRKSPHVLSLCIVLILALPWLFILLKGNWSEYLTMEQSASKALMKSIKWGSGLLVLGVLLLLFKSGAKGQINQANSKSGFISQARERWGDRWLIILMFVCVFRLGDHLLGLFLFPSLNDLGFTAIEIATVAKSWGLLATIIGTMLGGWLVYRIGLMRVMVIAGIAQAVSNLTLSAQALLGHSVPFLYVSIGVQDLALGMVNATFVAYISSLCDRRYAATHFAFLSALSAVLKTFIQAGSGWVVEACKVNYGLNGGWALYFALTSVLAVPGLVLLMILMRSPKSEYVESIN